MIQEYFRPKNVQEALALKEKHPGAVFIGGGTTIKNITKDFTIIDLQDLQKEIKERDNTLLLGATVTLTQIYQKLSKFAGISTAIKIEAGKNLRNQITIGGLIKMADGRSPLLTCLFALKTSVLLEPSKEKMDLQDFVSQRESNNDLIENIEISIPDEFYFESIARSPLDKPIVCCAVAKYEKDKKISIGGYGNNPLTISSELFDNDEKLEKLLIDSFKNDQWASKDYRVEISKTLIYRMLKQNG